MIERDYLAETDSAIGPAMPLEDSVEVNISENNNPALNVSVGQISSIMDNPSHDQPSIQNSAVIGSNSATLELQNRRK
jgi:hypothetical protein